MKKPSSRIRAEIARLQEDLKQAETREAERIGRLALKAGLGEMAIEEADLQAALGDLAAGFRAGKHRANGQAHRPATQTTPLSSGASASDTGEA